MDLLTINEVALGECDVDDPEVFMNDWANSGDLDVDFVAMPDTITFRPDEDTSRFGKSVGS